MVKTELLAMLRTAITRSAETKDGDLDAVTLREIRREMNDCLAKAFETAPCDHPPRDCYNGFCFICGRTVMPGKKEKTNP